METSEPESKSEADTEAPDEFGVWIEALRDRLAQLNPTAADLSTLESTVALLELHKEMMGQRPSEPPSDNRDIQSSPDPAI